MSDKEERAKTMQRMLECEARYVCNLRPLERRQRYLDGVEEQRGKAAADQLREEIKRQWK
jgi:hypothetical protein